MICRCVIMTTRLLGTVRPFRAAAAGQPLREDRLAALFRCRPAMAGSGCRSTLRACTRGSAAARCLAAAMLHDTALRLLWLRLPRQQQGTQKRGTRTQGILQPGTHRYMSTVAMRWPPCAGSLFIVSQKKSWCGRYCCPFCRGRRMKGASKRRCPKASRRYARLSRAACLYMST